MTTPARIINLALKDAGVLGIGQTANPEDTSDALDTLNFMITQWRRKRWLIYVLETFSVVSTGAASYTVGAGGTINTGAGTGRPDRIESAFMRQLTGSPQPVDTPLQPLFAREDYNRIAIKALNNSFSQFFYYETSWPLGVFYPWPIGNTSIYSYFISVKKALAQITPAQINTDYSIPDEYVAALRYNLADRTISSYPGLAPNSKITGLAKDALNVLRSANFQIGRLQMPTELVRPGLYNVYSDQIY